MIMSVAIAICIISCMVLFSHYLSQYFVDETVAETAKQKDTLSKEVESEIEKITDCTNTIYYQNIKQYDFRDKEFKSSLTDILMDSNDEVSGISLYDMNGNVIWDSMDDKKSVSGEEWYKDAKENIEDICFGDRIITCEGNIKKVIPVSRYVEFVNSGKTQTGVLCLRVYIDSIEAILDDYKNSRDEYCYLTDAAGKLIYHPFLKEIQSGLYQEWSLNDISSCENCLVKKHSDTRWVLQRQQIGYTGWNMVVVNSLSNIRIENLNIYYVVWLLLLVVGIVLIIMDMALFRNITEPVYQLLHTMKEFGKGDYSVKAQEDGIGELKDLSAQFNIMAERLKKQMDEIRKNEREKRKMEKKLLQSQINPHFLYNTLDSIIWMIQSGEYEGAGQMVSLLAKFFRISLSRGKDIILLEKEIEHATSYLAIQNIRFKDKFVFSVNAEPGLMHYCCPKLSIQPLLENAIYHGMEGMYDDGEISINVYEKNHNIHIDVVDNGLGMSQDKIDYIMHNTVVSSKQGSGIGVRNVDERIKLIFGEEYGVFIESEIDEGTIASIIIPKMEDVDER